MSMEGIIYLDNAATTYPKPESVYQKMDEVNRGLAVNAGRGSYALAKKATDLIEDARKELLCLVNGTEVAEVVFSPSATSALNQIIGGMPWKKEDIVYVSPFEHNAVMRPLHHMQKQYGFSIEEMPFSENSGGIDLEKLQYQFSGKKPTVVFMTHCSNVTGYVLPISKICEIAKTYDAVTVVDASQSLGLLPIDLKKMKIDFLIFAGHKNLYGPFGVGGFVMRHKIQGQKCEAYLMPYLCGGTGSDSLNLEMPEAAPARYEAASSNIIAIAGLVAALEVLQDNKRQLYEEKERADTECLVEGLKRIRDVKLYCPGKEEHVGIIAFNIEGYQASDVGMLLDEDYGIAVRTGYHCAPLIHKYLQDQSYAGVVRVSVGRFTTKEEIEGFLRAVAEIAEG